MSEDNYQDLALLSKRGVLGEIIPEHRALFRSSFSILKWLTIIFFPLVFNFILLKSFPLIGRAWLTLFEFWFEKIEMPVKVELAVTKLASVEVELPIFFMPSSAPDTNNWWLLALLATGLFILVQILPKRLMPLSYIIGFVGLILVSSLIYFAVVPARFPYTFTGYMDNLIKSCVWLMFVIPWVHALIYYIFDFSLKKKITLTAITLIFIALAFPFQLMAQTVLLVKYSMILLPVLYVFFGLFLLIFCCLAIYGWAMSWTRNV